MNNNQRSYPYSQYQPYYESYYYNANAQPQVPQGDPSAALSSVMYQYQQHQPQPDHSYHYPMQYQPPQQRAAPYSNIHINPAHQNNYIQYHQPPAQYYADYYAVPDQRPIVKYDDLSHSAIEDTVKEKEVTPRPEPPPSRPKLCCNRWLKTPTAVAQHEKLHVKCPSCDFMCLPSVLPDHEEIYHGKIQEDKKKKPSKPDGIIPPNAPRIETPEDLAAWIAARKKNWPSQANVERKQKEVEARITRGELPLDNKRRKLNHHGQRLQQQQQQQSSQQEAPSSNVASIVAAAYDSDDSDDFMDPEKDAISSKDPSSMGIIALPSEESLPRKRCKWFAMGRCKKGDQCTFLHQKPEPKNKNQPAKPKNAVIFKRRPNLLNKLLEKEIRQEKSVILQCMRYIVDNNFFGKGGADVKQQQQSKPPSTKNSSEVPSVDSTVDHCEETL